MIDIYNKYLENPSVSIFGPPEDLTPLFYTAWKCLGEPQNAGPIGERLFTDETLLKNRSLDKVRFIALSIIICRDLSEELRSKLERWLEAASPGENRAEAVRRFVNYLRGPTGELDLFNLDLTSLPDIFDHPGFEGLTYLRISENKLAFLPETIGNLSYLETLSAEGNLLTEIPESLGRCRELRYLLCGNNQMTSIPAGVVSLIPEMFIVNFVSNRLTSFPPERAQTQTSYEDNPIPELVLPAMMKGLAEMIACPELPFKYFNSFHKVCFDLPCGRKLFHLAWVDTGSPADYKAGKKAFLGQGELSMSNEKRIELLQQILAPYVIHNPAIFNMPQDEIEKIMPLHEVVKMVPLQTVFPSLKIIGKEAWEYCLADCGGLEANGLSIDTFPSNEKVVPIVKRMSEHAIEGNLGLTLLALPQGLSLRKLKELFPDRLREMYGDIMLQHGKHEVKKTRFIVMTNGIFEGSRNKLAAQQSELVAANKCQLPGLLSVVVLSLITEKIGKFSLGVRLFGDVPLTYTTCREKVDGSPIVVGDFNMFGLLVDDFYEYPSYKVGVGGEVEVL